MRCNPVLLGARSHTLALITADYAATLEGNGSEASCQNCITEASFDAAAHLIDGGEYGWLVYLELVYDL